MKANWVTVKTAITPPLRSEVSTASDRDSQRVILFGAFAGGKISQLERGASDLSRGSAIDLSRAMVDDKM